MLIARFFIPVVSVGLTVLGAGVVCGQPYPNKPIRIVTGSVGGGSDFTSRLIAQGISGPLGQQIVIDNRPTGIVTAEVVSKAPPDGYTLLVSGSNFWIGPLLQNTPYDPVKDFSPITSIDRSALILVVPPSSPINSVKELIAYAKARPGELNYSSGPAGGPGHLAPELFKAMAGVNIVRIAYKGGALPVTAVLAGEVQLHFAGPSSVLAHIKSGKLRALAITTAQPSALAPGVPTVAASGLEAYEFSQIGGIFTQAKTPAAIIRRLNQEIVRFLNRDDVKEKFLSTGSEVATGSPEQLAAEMKSDRAKMDKLIKDAGIKAE